MTCSVHESLGGHCRGLKTRKTIWGVILLYVTTFFMTGFKAVVVLTIKAPTGAIL